ncbi:MAG: class I SAM-dependent methyltransferase [Rhabdochlamydiaceae bacterium]|nr:class I SAM-dependent methyltransferase [Rhabdochlamydiaceae bacterium]
MKKPKRILSLFLIVASTSFANHNALDLYLRSHGFPMTSNGRDGNYTNEGYMTTKQQKQFTEHLKHHRITSIAEIGLNGGHSAFHFIQQCKNLKKFVSFDLGIYPETQCAVQFFQDNYGQMFEFFGGPSQRSVPEYHDSNPSQTFDLIYIDGSHEYEECYLDIINCKQLAHKNTIVWFDDCTFEGPTRAIKELVEAKFIVLDGGFLSDGKCGGRSWLQFRYINN